MRSRVAARAGGAGRRDRAGSWTSPEAAPPPTTRTAAARPHGAAGWNEPDLRGDTAGPRSEDDPAAARARRPAEAARGLGRHAAYARRAGPARRRARAQGGAAAAARRRCASPWAEHRMIPRQRRQLLAAARSAPAGGLRRRAGRSGPGRRSAPDTSTFLVQHAELFFEGTRSRRLFEYRLQVDFAEAQILKDAFVQWRHGNWIAVRVGQYKVPVRLPALPAQHVLRLRRPERDHERVQPGARRGRDGPRAAARRAARSTSCLLQTAPWPPTAPARAS